MKGHNMKTLHNILNWIYELLCDKHDKHPIHNDSRPGSYWYESHKKENYR